eukprot:TRINITY_DN654_c0_g1_i1.p1 TRINITY_DN654_c0_g1~~TRINITY_DN654_c0_g1_i1.p1  ORF type:complete len:213 (+),score=9.50 TRINITY_DN654_c0_g1_i1:99-737(+)
MQRLTSLLLLLCIALGLVSGSSVEASLVPVEFFVMSKCPYAQSLVGQFNTNVMALAGLPSITNITFNFIASVDSTQPTGFFSKHGQDEVRGDFYELCVQDIAPDKLWDFVYCNDYDFGGYANIPGDVQSCATQTKVPQDALANCYKSNGSSLLKTSISITNGVGAQYSPTLFIGGQCVYGGLDSCTNLDPTTDAMKVLICQLWTGTKPSGCN